ncbi:MAG: ATP-binding protein [Pseudomonadota bacterium]|nr:ATP-binding protein [Pseudomonadota bacterium]
MLQDIADRLGVELDDETRERVSNEQLQMVWSHATVATVVATAFAIVMAKHFEGAISESLVQFWIGVKVLIATPRVVQAQIFRKRGFPGGNAWRQGTHWLLALDGAVWGIAGFFLMGLDASNASLAVASLIGVACVATFGFQVSRVATLAYVVPIIAPMIAGMLLRGDSLGFYYSVALGLLLFQIVVTATRSDAKLSETFFLRLHAARVTLERTAALELAQRQSAAKSQFLGTVSHELRTPIHGMLGIARLVHVESGDSLVKKRMELIESSGTHLLGLVTDLIDVSRVESGQMRIQQIAFDLRAEIERVADIYSLRAAEKGLAFTLDSEIEMATWVTGDPARMRQVLHNLLGNAIKFTQKGWVHLMIRVGDEPGQLRFEIRDTGIGISEEHQKLVFDAFHQVGAGTDGRQHGTGLGLTIAHEIAQLLGGGLTLSSRPGFGSVFTFWLTFAPGSPAQPAAVDANSNESIELCARVLLVEDNDVNALIAGAMLANQGHQVEHVTDGAEAVRRALREIDRPDIVLMDCMMPTMDGFDASRSIRVQELAMALPRIPIIALSAIIDDVTERQVIASGMDDSLGKPFTNDQLRNVMHPWLALRESERLGALRGVSRGVLVDKRGAT